MPKTKRMMVKLYEMFNDNDFSGITTFELSVQLEYIVKWLVYYLNDIRLAKEFIKSNSIQSNLNHKLNLNLLIESNIKIKNYCQSIRRVKLNPELIAEYKKHELYQLFERYFNDKPLLIRCIVYYLNQYILSYRVSNIIELNQAYQINKLLSQFNVNHLDINRSTTKYIYYHYDSSYINVNVSTLEYWMDLIDKPSMVNVIVFMFLTNYVSHDNLRLFKNGLDYRLYFITPKTLTTNIRDFIYYITLLKKYKRYIRYNVDLMDSDQKQRYEHLVNLMN